MSSPACKIVSAWAIKTPLGKLLIPTVSKFRVQAWMEFQGYRGIESPRAAMVAGYRATRVIVHES